MPELAEQLQKLLKQLGFSHESISRFRFGGIVGKVALIALAGFAAIVGVAKYVTGSILQIIAIALLAAVLLIIIRWILNYAERHPQSATLEGAELIFWQQQQLMLEAKGFVPPQDSPSIGSPLLKKEIEPPEPGAALGS